MILRRFLHTADWHLIGTSPRCRKDPNWLETQCQMLRFLVSTANAHKVPLVACGDIFDKPRVATEVVNMAIRELKEARFGVFLLPGNHDLQFHDAALVHASSLGTLLETFLQIPQIDGIQDAQPFGLDNPTGAKVAFTHQLVFRDEKSKPPMAKSLTASELLDQFPDADWIFTGDHHSAWHYTERVEDASDEGTCIRHRHVVNPGCTIIHAADMIGQVAKCALVDIDAGSVEWIEIPDDPANLSDDHLRTEEERVSRIESFLEKVQGQGEAKILDFKANLETKMQELEPTSPVHKALVAIQAKATTEEK